MRTHMWVTGLLLAGAVAAQAVSAVKNDFDGDFQTDIGIFRPSSVTWYVFQSSAGPMPQFQFGTQGDIPVPADYDGDGTTDLAVFRPSTVTWYVFGSTEGPWAPFQFGTYGDMPAPADYDGDGIADLAIYRPSTMTWYVFGSYDGPIAPFVFGAPGDYPVPADYDADGIADLAVFRPSTVTWYVFGTTAGPMAPFQFGTFGDLPVPGDYDADGETDIAIFRPSTLTWYIFGTTAGPMAPFQFGTYGDMPIGAPASAYSASAGNVNIVGTWTGAYTIEGYGDVSTIVRITAQDADGNVSGNAGGSGTIQVSGKVTGNHASLVFNFSGGTTDTVQGDVYGNAMDLYGTSQPYGWAVRWNLVRSTAFRPISEGGDIEGFVKGAILNFRNR